MKCRYFSRSFPFKSSYCMLLLYRCFSWYWFCKTVKIP